MASLVAALLRNASGFKAAISDERAAVSVSSQAYHIAAGASLL